MAINRKKRTCDNPFLCLQRPIKTPRLREHIFDYRHFGIHGIYICRTNYQKRSVDTVELLSFTTNIDAQKESYFLPTILQTIS